MIEYKGFKIEYSKKRVKYLRLKITKTGDIKLVAPLNASKFQIESFISSHTKWIEKTLSKITKTDPNSIKFLGKSYQIQISPDFKIIDNQIFTPDIQTFTNYANSILKDLINQYINIYNPKINRPINAIRIKKMNTRWGSCNSKKGYLNFSTNLIQKDIKFIEYVVLHELAHLIYPHHQKEFYDFILSLMPDFKDRLNL
ncbi:M48 family metallopeptidase [Campylobacter devanensis]|uniref:M48 family metallopeptidase n=1 Tax=Campylobacter devanensis TaxID=3161138 RepID=UPI0015D845B7|nr:MULTISPECIES: SprT family zinc-dependent metalloprotease [unclassified Campylobacter]